MDTLQRYRFGWKRTGTKTWIVATLVLALVGGTTNAAPYIRRSKSRSRQPQRGVKLSPAKKPKTPNERLGQALRKHDIDGAYQQILAGADVNLRIDDPTSDLEIPTALALAASAGDAKFTRKALELGAQVEPTYYRGFSPLLLAVASGNPEVVKLLLDAGAAVQPTFPGHPTPLSLAVGTGNHEAIRLLRAAKAPGEGETRRFLVMREGTLGTFYIPGYRIKVQARGAVTVTTHDDNLVYYGFPKAGGSLRIQNDDFQSWVEVGLILIRY